MPYIERIVKQQHYQPESPIKDNQNISNPCKSTKPFSWVLLSRHRCACRRPLSFNGISVVPWTRSCRFQSSLVHVACDLCIHLCWGQGTVSPCRTTSTVGVTSEEACLDILHVEGSNSNEDSSRVVRFWNAATLRHPKNGMLYFFSRFEKPWQERPCRKKCTSSYSNGAMVALFKHVRPC